MKLSVSNHLCSGQGRCYTLVPELFTADDEGYCDQRGHTIDVPEGGEERSRLGMDACPEGAITLDAQQAREADAHVSHDK